MVQDRPCPGLMVLPLLSLHRGTLALLLLLLLLLLSLSILHITLKKTKKKPHGLTGRGASQFDTTAISGDAGFTNFPAKFLIRL